MNAADVDKLLAARQTILTVAERGGVDRKDWPVSQGVAFAPGALSSIEQLALEDQSGKAIPFSARPLAWWDKERKAIRFALITSAVDVPARKSRQYVLSWNRPKAIKPAVPAQPVEVEERHADLVVKTGAFHVQFSKSRPLLWQEVRLGKDVLLRPGTAGTLVVTRQDGARFTMQAAKDGYKLEIEEASPLRVVVKQSGVLASEDGKTTFCQYEIRHTIFASQSWIHLRPTLIFTCDWPSEWLRGYGLELHPTKPIEVLSSGADGKLFAIKRERDTAQIVQAEDNELWAKSGKDQVVTGKRGDGFVQARFGRQTLTVAVRDFWQQHPAGFVAEKDKLSIKLWADESGRELDFDRHWTTRNHVFLDKLPNVTVKNQKVPGGEEFDEEALRRELRKLPKGTWVNLRLGRSGVVVHLDPKLLDRIAAEFKGQLEFFANDMFELGGLHSPRGRAKSHDLLVAFGPTDPAKLATAWQNPLYAIAPPLYTCGTGALGPLRGREPGRFKEFDDPLMKSAELELTSIEERRHNGMLYHGSLLNWHNNPGYQYIFQLFGKEQGFRPHERMGVCTAGSTLPGGGMQRGAWLMFAYTGEPRWLEFAQRVTGHLIDVDTCHLEYRPGGRQSQGYLAGEGLTPWSFWGNIIQSYVGMMHHYCFTGDPRALESARLVSKWVMDQYDESWDKAYETYIYDYTVRAWYIPAVSLLEYYWLTWDERALTTVNRMWEQIQQREKKKLPLLLLANHGDIFICTLHDLHPDPQVRKAAGQAAIDAADGLLKRYAENPRDLTQSNFIEFRLLTLAHALTGKKDYVELARKRMNRLPVAGYNGDWYGYVVPGWPGMAASTMPWIFPALHHDELWRSKERK
ncbi:MAG: hypothetical protein RMJ52_15685 [Gemmataceae bacterium]|nr:hypothetical protein [Gemmataceae bacterium]